MRKLNLCSIKAIKKKFKARNEIVCGILVLRGIICADSTVSGFSSSDFQ